MAFNLSPVLRQRFFDANGNPLAGGKIYTYQAGTSTPQATYTDSTGATPNANPVVLDSNGYAPIWFNTAFSYKVIVKDSSDVTIFTEDNIVGLLSVDSVNTASIQDGAVTTAKLADDSVTSAKLQDDASIDGNRAVTTNHIRNDAVTAQKISLSALDPAEAINIAISSSVASNALTLTVTDSAGSTPSTSSPVRIPFRSSTASIGSNTLRSVTSALSITIPSGTTIGTTSGQTEWLYLYAIDNAGTIELAVTVDGRPDEGSLVSTTAVSGGSTRTTLYSATARSNVACKLIGRVKILESTAGTWASNATELSTAPFGSFGAGSQFRLDAAVAYASTNTKILYYTNTRENVGSDITVGNSATLGASATIVTPGVYAFGFTQAIPAGATIGLSLNSSQLTTSFSGITASDIIASADVTANAGGSSIIRRFKPGDVIRPHGDGAGPSTTSYRGIFWGCKISD